MSPPTCLLKSRGGDSRALKGAEEETRDAWPDFLGEEEGEGICMGEEDGEVEGEAVEEVERGESGAGAGAEGRD